MKVVVTGAGGFVGRTLLPALAGAGMEVLGWYRRPPAGGDAVGQVVGFPAPEDFAAALDGVDAVVHLAARAHQLGDRSPDPVAAFRRDNVDLTVTLAEAAARAGVGRFVLLSSSGAQTAEEAVRAGGDEAGLWHEMPYNMSKLEAERRLAAIGAATGLGWCAIRSPLVYGPGVKGNLASLMSAVRRRVPLPLASIRNARSVIYVGNLADAVRLGLTHPRAAGAVFAVKDRPDLSTPDLVRRLAAGAGLPPPILLPCPPALLHAAGRLTGRTGQVERLAGSLVVDDRFAVEELGWRPPFGLDEAFRSLAA